MDPDDRLHLAVAILVVLLIGAAYWLMTEMKRTAAIEDCLAQRRRDCGRLLDR